MTRSTIHRRCLAAMSLPLLLLQPRVAEQRTLSVSVVDTSGRPVADAFLGVYPESGLIRLSTPLASTRTDRTGSAQLEWRASRRGRLIVYAPGHELLASTSSGHSQRLTLKEGRDVAFEIRDDTGTRHGLVEWALTAYVRVAESSDALGRGLLRGLPSGRIRATAKIGERSVVGTVSPETGRMVFKLPPSGTIEGRVCTDAVRPLPEATVLLLRPGAHATKVDAAGRFRISGLAAGRYVLEVSAPGFRTDTVELAIRASQTAVVPTVVLQRGSEVVARFVDAATGAPIRRPTVLLESNDPSGFSVRDVFAKRKSYVGTSDGIVRLTDLPLGISRLVLDTPPFERLRLPPVEISSEWEFLDLGTLLAGPGASLHVTVRDRAGSPRIDVPLRLDQGPGLSPVNPFERSTDERGQATFDRLGAGRYRLRVGGDERPGGTVAELERWITVEHSTGRLSRTVVTGGIDLALSLAASSGPLAGMDVTLMGDGDDDSSAVRGFVVQTPARMINTPIVRSARGVTDTQGRVVLSNVPLGPGRVSADLGDSTWSTPVVIAEEDRERLVLVPTGSVSFQIRGRDDGRPAAAHVSWDGQSGVRVRSFAGADGTVTLVGLAEESGVLQIRSQDHAPLDTEYQRLTDIPPVIVVDRAPPTTLTCTVVGSDGQPLKDASVELVRSARSAWRRFVVTDANGQAVFENVDPQPATLIARRPGYVSTVSSLTPAPGANDCAVRLSRGYRLRLTMESDGSADNETYRLRILDDRGISVENGLDDDSPRTLQSGGEASIGVLGPGRYTVELIASRRTRRGRVTIGEADAALTIR